MIFTIASIIAIVTLILLVRKALIWIGVKRNELNTTPVILWVALLALPSIGIVIRFEEFELVQLLHFLPRSGFIQAMIFTQLLITAACFIAMEVDIYQSKNRLNG